MPKSITATLKTISPHQTNSVVINAPDAICDTLSKNNYTVEIVELSPSEHSLYVVNTNKEDVIAVTYNPQVVSAISDAFKTIHNRLVAMEN